MHVLHFQYNILKTLKILYLARAINKIAPKIALFKKLPLTGKIKLNSSYNNPTRLSAPSSRERKLL